MKKLLLFASALSLGFAASAQTIRTASPVEAKSLRMNGERASFLQTVPKIGAGMARTTGLSDTLYYFSNNPTELFDTAVAYVLDAALPYDSGYFFGNNALNMKGFAECFEFNYNPDTTFHIIGFRSRWFGTVNPSSTQNVNVKIWKVGPQVSAGTKTFWRGWPGTEAKSQAFSVKVLGIGNGTAPDTTKNLYFSSPLTDVNYDFYLGYTLNNTWSTLAGDTVALRSTRDGKGVENNFYALQGANDTVLLTKSVLQLNDNSWRDLFFNIGFDVNYSIIPILQLKGSAISVKGVTNKNLTFFGNYPNPAVNSTNVKFGLKKAANVTLEVTDVNGRTLITRKMDNLSAGEHIVPVETSSLPSGNYVYVISTSLGDGMAAQMTVVR